MALKSFFKSKSEKRPLNNVEKPHTDNIQIIQFKQQKTSFSCNVTSLANKNEVINTSLNDISHLKPILKKNNLISFTSSQNKKLSFADRNKFSHKRELVETLNVKSFRYLNKMNTFKKEKEENKFCRCKCSVF